MAQLVPFQPDRADRVPGVWANQVRFAEDVDSFGGAEEAEWYGA